MRAAQPQTRVLLLSGAGDISPTAARAAGASGFAHKDWPARRIADAVHATGLGKTTFEPLQRLRERSACPIASARCST